MRTSLKKVGSRAGDWLWLLALLVLPGCDRIFGLTGGGIDPEFDPGPLNHISAVFCDIEKKSAPRRCPDVNPVTGLPILPQGIPLSRAALAFTTGDSSTIGLDYSADARSRCGGNPEIVTFEGPFPEGTQLCLNCSQLGTKYADANVVCVAYCEDLNRGDFVNVPPDVVAFCQAKARASTNTPTNDCLVGACSAAGNPNANFPDPRRFPEAVEWDPVSVIGVVPFFTQEPFGRRIGNIQRTKPTTVPPGAQDFGFDAGAASIQTFTRGDGYLEFSPRETDRSHVSGLATGPGPDTNPTLGDIGFAISLNFDSRFYIIENGALVNGPNANGSFGDYVAGQRFRVNVKDNNDGAGTATITYSFLAPGCAGTLCPDTPFYMHVGSAAIYPFRVTTSFREVDAVLADVNLVRIR